MNAQQQTAQQDERKAVVHPGKAEGLVQGRLAHHQPGQHGHDEQVAQVHHLLLGHVLVQAVAQLVGENGADLIRRHAGAVYAQRHILHGSKR